MDWLTRLLKTITVLLGMFFVISYLALSWYQLRYPFELEWMEGGSLVQITRILSGQQLYVRPTLEYVPYIYTPLYFYVSAGVAKILGISFLPLRLVSFLSTLGCVLMIYLFVHRQTKSRWSAVVSCCLFIATFRISGAWLNVARADSLALFFLLAGFYFIRIENSLKLHVLAGLLFFLAFLTKQSMLLITAPVMLYCAVVQWRRGLLTITAYVGLVLVSSYVLNRLHDGWYNFYIFELPNQHGILPKRLFTFWLDDLLSPLSIACSLSLFGLIALASHPTKRDFSFYLVVALGMAGGSWAGRLNVGSFNNVLLPAYAVIAILFGFASHYVVKSSLDGPKSHNRLFESLVSLLVICQFAVLIYNPRQYIPSGEDWAAGNQLVETIRGVDGDVLIPYHGYLALMAGKKSFAHAVAIREILGEFGGSTTDVGRTFVEELRGSLKQRQFMAIVLDDGWFLPEIGETYVRARSVFSSDEVFWPRTGKRTRPQSVYVPKN